jgi:hypothetical protein
MGAGGEGDAVPDGLGWLPDGCARALPQGARPPICGPLTFVLGRGALLAYGGDRRYLRSFSACSLRLAAQDVALSRRKQGFESPRERQ